MRAAPPVGARTDVRMTRAAAEAAAVTAAPRTAPPPPVRRATSTRPAPPPPPPRLTRHAIPTTAPGGTVRTAGGPHSSVGGGSVAVQRVGRDATVPSALDTTTRTSVTPPPPAQGVVRDKVGLADPADVHEPAAPGRRTSHR